MTEPTSTVPRNGARPFRVLGVQQIAIGGLDLSPLLALWRDCLGLEQLGTYELPEENVRETQLRLGSSDCHIDLMQPLDPAVAPRVHSPALNHFGLWIDNLHAAIRWLVERGVRIAPGGVRKGAAGHLVAFIHPKPSTLFPFSGCGVLIELVQAPASLLADLE